MKKTEECRNDHDALVTLIEGVKNLKDFFERSHIETQNTLKDIKDNISSRIDGHETRIVKLETAKTRQTVLLSVGIGILSILSTLLVIHMFR